MTSMHRRRLLGAAAALPFAQAGMAQELPLTPACGPQSALTPRQTEIFDLVVTGLTSHAIAVRENSMLVVSSDALRRAEL